MTANWTLPVSASVTTKGLEITGQLDLASITIRPLSEENDTYEVTAPVLAVLTGEEITRLHAEMARQNHDD